MINKQINIVYIDDDADNDLVKYLRDSYKYKDYNIKMTQISFKNTDTYETLLNDHKVRTANIIIIDSKLFENAQVTDGKFTGEEFQLILRKEYSFIEVIVISQNDIDGNKIVRKFKGDRGENPIEYYGCVMKQFLDDSIGSLLHYRKVSERLKINENIEKVMAEKILDSLDGIKEFNDLNSKEIDKIITLFKEIQNHYE